MLSLQVITYGASYRCVLPTSKCCRYPAARCRLEFPTDLSKHERAKWHSQAHRKGLPTESQGVGDDRFLSILSPQDVDSDGSGGPVGSVKHVHLSRAQRHRAQQIYDFCQVSALGG